ncbi:hypothetical protein BAZSYMB_SCAFFOLD00010_16 [Bathymodiolus azoricus thioautotrophic gill symbiont]|uniref:Uncharacterized protein n=1 Tax=Bathymodiolus azoricus thioautotrophic gill symbiont TaxID=235205 RepID=A0A1H6LIT3_9GAMM|nr:hypothetical protein BAZSYMB_SCAFFOLD00010_16 [Bathymodiolus azoricus thioautotrophic gill symbiont]
MLKPIKTLTPPKSLLNMLMKLLKLLNATETIILLKRLIIMPF